MTLRTTTTPQPSWESEYCQRVCREHVLEPRSEYKLQDESHILFSLLEYKNYSSSLWPRSWKQQLLFLTPLPLAKRLAPKIYSFSPSGFLIPSLLNPRIPSPPPLAERSAPKAFFFPLLYHSDSQSPESHPSPSSSAVAARVPFSESATHPRLQDLCAVPVPISPLRSIGRRWRNG
ncbi:hypothetical protein E2C01_081819 [Portunus trituberculatus]|uniref:Uncharacterized protein n=1 Tax=Portunus trituberculatus TaxID=210409 RepID=A0A5B7J3B3_PORTR|nr:hypothetical protein [Portunus trituberculatus]